MHFSAAIFGFSLACIFSLALTPLVRVLAVRRELHDLPGPHKIHDVARPLVGGLAIYGALALSLLATVYAFPRLDPTYHALTRAVILAGGLVVVLGLIDDLQGSRPWKKLLTQTLALAVVQLHVDVLGLPWGAASAGHGGGLAAGLAGPVLGTLLILPAVLGVTNAMNLIDGLDGLASGIAAASGVGLLALAWTLGDPIAAIVAAAVVGAALGFLRSNAHPAKIFMGDTGSMFLGFVLAILGARLFHGRPAPTTLVALALILWVPGIDAVYAVVRRVVGRRSIFRPDRGHIHHRLLDAGLSQRGAGIALCCLSALAAWAGVLVARGAPALPWIGAVLLATSPLAWVLRTQRGRVHAPPRAPLAVASEVDSIAAAIPAVAVAVAAAGAPATTPSVAVGPVSAVAAVTAAAVTAVAAVAGSAVPSAPLAADPALPAPGLVARAVVAQDQAA